MRTIDDVFRLWPSLAELARDLGHPYENVVKWKRRQTIPAHAWTDLIRAAERRGHVVTPSDLLILNPKRKLRASPNARSVS